MGHRRLWLSGGICAAVLVAPAAAQADSPDTSAISSQFGAPASSSASAVDDFYASRPGALVWLRDADTKTAAWKLPDILRRAPIDGLDNGAQLAAAVEAAIARGQPEDDRVISNAWVSYVRTLRRPVEGVSYGDTALRPQVPSANEILADARRAGSLSAHVDEIAAVNPFYSQLREASIAQGAAADPRVRATLDRLRLIPATGRAILVDVASAHLFMLENGKPVDSMKVIVGKTSSPSHLLASTIHYVTFNPYWNIPDDVARGRVAPVVLKRGVSYLKAARYETWSALGSKGERIDADSVDWKAVVAGEAPVYLRQLPGDANMMGAMKFGFANPFDIFLHDTPKKQLFAKDKRTLSMGCIRLEHADVLARWLLGREPVPPSSEPEQHVQLDKGVPVYVTSLTATVSDGQLAFGEDVYGLDAGLPQTAAVSPTTTAN
ncbi:L,D-transpeptidase family protein [Sphingomonas hankyongi]|uniref:L,D-transpeptidase family protein n=1 Tax=Sphingomonas hankyongi TaxID=2908209 RepID=A0ABT0S339_9SPHN|nr:L,D-transpeptidase family protein [Sphingomonas hankyongi]MCL6729950.1 L,D-transpeptidase family protein [Sphingomonas hankyongi]